MASVTDHLAGRFVIPKAHTKPTAARKEKPPKYTRDDAEHDERQFQAMIRKPG